MTSQGERKTTETRTVNQRDGGRDEINTNAGPVSAALGEIARTTGLRQAKSMTCNSGAQTQAWLVPDELQMRIG